MPTTTLQKTAAIWLGVSVLLTCIVAYFSLRRGTCMVPAPALATAEGFKATEAAATPQTELNNVLLKTMGTLKRMSKYLADPAVWKERLTFYTMTPGELARLQLQTPQ
jgi:hypothetical protein